MICAKCNRKFAENIYICPFCNYGLQTYEEIKRDNIQKGINHPTKTLRNISANDSMICPECGRSFKNSYYCKYCDCELVTLTNYNEIHTKRESKIIGTVTAINANTPKCPTCQSTNIQKISGLERGASVFAWGLFSKKINKSFKCNNCGYTW